MQKSMTLDEDFPRNIQYHFRFHGYSKNYIYTFFFFFFLLLWQYYFFKGLIVLIGIIQYITVFPLLI